MKYKFLSHREILLIYLADGKWHSTIELNKQFLADRGAIWQGIRTRASELHKNEIIEQKNEKKCAWYKLKGNKKIKIKNDEIGRPIAVSINSGSEQPKLF